MTGTHAIRYVTSFWLLAISTVVYGGEPDAARRIQVTGVGRVTAKPDMATVTVGVLTEGETASDALAANNRAMRQLMDVLASNGIARRDVQTAGFRVTPQYVHAPQRGTPPRITGYRVSNQVRVRVRKLERLGELLDAVVQAGSNQVSGIVFSVADTEDLLNQARTAAVRDARARAELYAHAADVRLGSLVSLMESSPVRPVPQMRMMAAEAAGVPIAEGELELSVTVNVVYSIAEDR